MKEKMILGISGSPRKDANVDILLRLALEEAQKTPGIQTETVYLRDYEIHGCNCCYACCKDAAKGGDRACLSFKDGMDQLYPKLAECSGLIIASPVFFGNVSSQLKAFMDRTEGLLRYSTSKWKYALNNKVGAGLAVGGNRNGGQEFTLQAIHYYYLVHNMIVVGTGGEPTPGCYLGACGTTSPVKGEVRDAVLSDALGMKSARMVGHRIAEAVQLLK